MLELKPKSIGGSYQARIALEDRQPHRLLLALLLLLVALIGILLVDRSFWFGAEQGNLESDLAEPAVTPHPVATPVPVAANHAPSNPVPAKKQIRNTGNSAARNAAKSPTVAVKQTVSVLSPLSVEVVAGNARSIIHPDTDSTQLQITQTTSVASAAPAKSTFAAATNAAGREAMSVEAAQANYPMLAQHMNVQGSVVLQAVIGADGVIQDLRVLSGPDILASAARQAVREWRFKPVYENGQPVETKAKITVNFTIKVADNSTKAS